MIRSFGFSDVVHWVDADAAQRLSNGSKPKVWVRFPPSAPTSDHKLRAIIFPQMRPSPIGRWSVGVWRKQLRLVTCAREPNKRRLQLTHEADDAEFHRRVDRSCAVNRASRNLASLFRSCVVAFEPRYPRRRCAIIEDLLSLMPWASKPP